MWEVIEVEREVSERKRDPRGKRKKARQIGGGGKRKGVRERKNGKGEWWSERERGLVRKWLREKEMKREKKKKAREKEWDKEEEKRKGQERATERLRD